MHAQSETTSERTPLLGFIAQRHLPDVISEQIVELIRNGALRPGQRLPSEQELARQLGVGRTSVREGLQKLKAVGIVEVVKGRGAFVSELTVDDAHGTFARWSAEHRFAIEELLEVRIALESVAAGLAAVRAEGEDVAELEERHNEHALARDQRDLVELVRTDARFHDALMLASHNALIPKMYAMLVAELTEFRRRTLGLPGAAERSAAGHGEIVDAIRERDPAAARAAAIKHLWVLYREVHEVPAAATARGRSRTQLAPRAVFERR